MVKYSLFDNPVTPDPDDCKAIVQDAEKIGIDDLIDDVTTEGSILKRTECVAVVHAVFMALGKQLKKGKGFTSDYLVLSHSIKGVFDNQEDSFDPKRHQICVNVRLGSALRQMSEGVEVLKVKSTVPVPVLDKVYDHWTQTENDQLTPRSSVDLYGENLKIGDMNNPEQGIFLIDSKGEEVKVDRLTLNQPKKLVFSVPETLKKGNYSLEIRTVMRNNKNLRVGRLNEVLVVV